MLVIVLSVSHSSHSALIAAPGDEGFPRRNWGNQSLVSKWKGQKMAELRFKPQAYGPKAHVFCVTRSTCTTESGRFWMLCWSLWTSLACCGKLLKTFELGSWVKLVWPVLQEDHFISHQKYSLSVVTRSKEQWSPVVTIPYTVSQIVHGVAAWEKFTWIVLVNVYPEAPWALWRETSCSCLKEQQ